MEPKLSTIHRFGHFQRRFGLSKQQNGREKRLPVPVHDTVKVDSKRAAYRMSGLGYTLMGPSGGVAYVGGKETTFKTYQPSKKQTPVAVAFSVTSPPIVRVSRLFTAPCQLSFVLSLLLCLVLNQISQQKSSRKSLR